MNVAEAKLIIACRRTATSHRHDGCSRTADLLERAANKIEQLLRAAEKSNLNPATGLEGSVLRVGAKGSLPGPDCSTAETASKQPHPYAAHKPDCDLRVYGNDVCISCTCGVDSGE